MAAVTLGFVESFAALELKVDHLLIAVLIQDGSGYGSSLNDRITHAVFRVSAVKKDLIKGNGATDFGIELLDVKFDALRNAVLFTAGFDDCESHMPEPDEVEEPAGSARKSRAGGPGDSHTTPAGASGF